MKFKNIEPRLEHLDNLIHQCGYFATDGEYDGEYGCSFPVDEKQEPGLCFANDCPFGHVADLRDLKKHDEYLYDQWKDDEYSPSESGSQWMIIYREAK